jgi:hypothetical protein
MAVKSAAARGKPMMASSRALSVLPIHPHKQPEVNLDFRIRRMGEAPQERFGALKD